MVELSAIADGGRRTLYWFVNDQFVGEGTSVMWQARPGDFLVRVVDDQGQGEVRQLRVVWASG
jgi:penicillin-binding protein 1C